MDELIYFLRTHKSFLLWAFIGFLFTTAIYRYGLDQADREKESISKITFHESVLSLTSFKDSTVTLQEIVYSEKKFKVIVSLNASCEMCIEELRKWNVLFSVLDRRKFDVAFISNNTTPELLKYHLRMVPQFKEHAFCDVRNVFFKTNKIYQSSIFKTFIIQGEQIVVWGTPFQNNEIRNEYLKLLSL